MPRNWRIFFAGLAIAKWLVPHLRCFTLPVAVKRNRFFVDLCVFCLVIFESFRDSTVLWSPPSWDDGMEKVQPKGPKVYPEPRRFPRVKVIKLHLGTREFRSYPRISSGRVLQF